MQHQADAMMQLREYNQRTEDNLSRLISGVDKLAHELPKRLAAAQQSETGGESPGRNKEGNTKDGSTRDSRANKSTGSGKKRNLMPIVLRVVLAVGIVGAIAYGIHSRNSDSSTKVPPIGKEVETANEKAAVASSKPVPVVTSGDTKTKLEAAKQYMERKEYATAEDIYKQVVQAEPDNVDALTGLASVLYREDKIEESAAVLDRIPKK